MPVVKHSRASRQYTLDQIEAEWRIYASTNHINIGSDNGLSPYRHQAII